MRILVDILHPAHVHFFRNFHREMLARGHEFFFTARTKECATDLLERYAIPHQVVSAQRSGLGGLAWEMTSRTARLCRIMRRFRPDVMTGIMGPSIALAGKLFRVPAVVFYDTEFANQTNWFTYPLAYSVCTPDCYEGRVNGNHVSYPGYHELTYLHPSRFEPDPAKLAAFGVSGGEPYSVVRFVSWKASHDVHEKGLTLEQKKRVITLLERHGRVLVSSESALPPDLAGWRASGPVEDIHHLLAFAQVFVGESATMASESAVLGTPAVFIATTGRGYTNDQQRRYGIVRYYTEDEFEEAYAVIPRLIAESGSLGARAREQMLEDKIDVTGWMVDYFEREFGAGR